MKILYCITRSDWGGAQAHLFDLISEGMKKGIQCEVVIGEKGPLFERLEEIGVRVHYLESLVHPIKPLSDMKAIVGLYKIIKKVNPDIVHLHSTKAGWIGRISGKLARKKVIFTAHGWCFTEGIKNSRRYIGIVIEKLLGYFTDKIICVSEFDRQLALKCGVGNEKKLLTIYNGVREKVDLKKIQLVEDDSVVKVVMTARFSEQKDQATLIKAVPLLNDNIHVFLIGNGEKLDESKELAKKIGVDNRVHFLGERNDVMDILNSSDIFVLSSHYEGLPISIIEAMSVGLPVVCSNVGGISELINEGQNGYLFQTGNVQELYECIAKVKMNKNKLEQMGLNSREVYLENYTLSEFSNRTISIYK